MSEDFYYNISHSNYKDKDWFSKSEQDDITFYECDVINLDFNKWIDGGMKDVS